MTKPQKTLTEPPCGGFCQSAPGTGTARVSRVGNRGRGGSVRVFGGFVRAVIMALCAGQRVRTGVVSVLSAE
ncbi:protein of unknown function [Streptomyces sp. KY70]|nr:protein of unknown function [Streptomyces sp. KY70]